MPLEPIRRVGDFADADRAAVKDDVMRAVSAVPWAFIGCVRAAAGTQHQFKRQKR